MMQLRTSSSSFIRVASRPARRPSFLASPSPSSQAFRPPCRLPHVEGNQSSLPRTGKTRSLGASATAAAGVQLMTVTVSGVPTEVVRLPATKGPAKLQVLLVPGNPGSALYYIEHMQQLHRAMDGEVEVVSITHAGHAPEYADGPGNKLRSIHDQIQQKADFMRQHLLLPGRPPLVVAGHSIGAYIAVNAVRDVERGPTALPVVKVICLMGFFWIDQASPEIKVMRLLSAGYEVMGGVTRLISALPAEAQMAVVRYFSGGGMDQSAQDLTKDLLVASSVRNNFFMAHTEFRILMQPPPWSMLRDLGNRLHVLGCPNDFWFSEAQYQEMQLQIDGLQATWMEDVGHAYCTSQTQCIRVSQFMKAILHEALDSLEPELQQSPDSLDAPAAPTLG